MSLDVRELAKNLLDQAKEIEPKVISIRRIIHETPELAYQENNTASLVENELKRLGIDVKRGVGLPTAVIGELDTGKEGKTVALRADMDALPIEEMTDLPFKSKVKGIMHACGHDTHVAMLLGAAELISRNKDLLSGKVKFIFQPAEEEGSIGGAKPLIEAGVLNDVDYVFGLHVSNSYPSKAFITRKGAFMAIPDSFKIIIRGKSGHASAPHNTVDPVFISAQIVTALQAVRSRITDPVQPFVLSITTIHAGTKDNIIPDEAIMEGTIRSLDYKVREKAITYTKKIVESICTGFDAKCEVTFSQDVYPLTVNHPEVTDEVMDHLKHIPGSVVLEGDPILGAEDFSRYLQVKPGTFIFLGTRNENTGSIHPNHSSKFTVDEDVLKYGSTALALLAIAFSRKK
ncbi:carboxypeptidase CpsA [Candidatus Acidianus copahuensis]|uniref:carboxypeptidase CpsA n=1 Tax=Candidatus Acidianus copahuensis TaxID=1160895 RepID=UPI00064E7634|nr:carboxypeptidase CpsA [Candidatus Acidianus copahuensis]